MVLPAFPWVAPGLCLHGPILDHAEENARRWNTDRAPYLWLYAEENPSHCPDSPTLPCWCGSGQDRRQGLLSLTLRGSIRGIFLRGLVVQSPERVRP